MTANAHTYPNGSAAREVFADTMAEAVDEIKTVGTREALCVFVGLYQYRVVEATCSAPAPSASSRRTAECASRRTRSDTIQVHDDD